MRLSLSVVRKYAPTILVLDDVHLIESETLALPHCQYIRALDLLSTWPASYELWNLEKL